MKCDWYTESVIQKKRMCVIDTKNERNVIDTLSEESVIDTLNENVGDRYSKRVKCDWYTKANEVWLIH